MDKYIYIVADTNDGDYISELTIIKDKTLEQIMPVIEAIKFNNADCNWDDGENADSPLTVQYPDLPVELISMFNDYVPYGEYGVHTIEHIEIYEVESVKMLL